MVGVLREMIRIIGIAKRMREQGKSEEEIKTIITTCINEAAGKVPEDKKI